MAPSRAGDWPAVRVSKDERAMTNGSCLACGLLTDFPMSGVVRTKQRR